MQKVAGYYLVNPVLCSLKLVDAAGIGVIRIAHRDREGAGLGRNNLGLSRS